MITGGDQIDYISDVECRSGIIAPGEPFPETPRKPTLCDIVFNNGLKLENVYLDSDTFQQIKVYKNVEPCIVIGIWYGVKTPEEKDFPQYIGWVGYEHVCTIVGVSCIIFNKQEPKHEQF